ncbi:MAG: hypothetical protein ACRC80_24700, partial [Waterburya sp.]
MPCQDLATLQQLIQFRDTIDNRIEDVESQLTDFQSSIEDEFSDLSNNIISSIDGVRNDIMDLREKIERTYEILGGDNWFNENGITPLINIDFEQRLRAEREAIYNFDGEYNINGTLEVGTTSITQFITRAAAVIFARLGLDDFPCKVPEDITLDLEAVNSEDLLEKLATRTIDIPTQSQFNSWQFRQLDAILGRFPIRIDIEDNDLIQTGSQTARIRLPNVAETLAELTGKVLQNDAKVNAIIGIAMRLLVETATDKLTNIKTHYLTEAITEYLNFKDKKSRISVPFTFDLSKLQKETEEGELKSVNPSLSDFLQITNMDVEIDEYNDDI